MIIYNDYKNKDWLKYKKGLPSGATVIVNNEDYSKDVVDHLANKNIFALYSSKLCDEPNEYCYALDAENYRDDLDYASIKTSTYLYPAILFPENLGGDKYKDYDKFLLGVKPRIVCMERTYNVWKPWDLLRFWLRNKYLSDAGIKVYMGIWPESLPWICQRIQLFFAKWISGNNIFWYSETKSLPNEKDI